MEVFQGLVKSVQWLHSCKGHREGPFTASSCTHFRQEHKWWLTTLVFKGPVWVLKKGLFWYQP